MTLLHTSRGKAAALRALAARREQNRDVTVDNAALPAGAPIYLPCVGCGVMLAHPEDYFTRRAFCEECAALLACGWLE